RARGASPSNVWQRRASGSPSSAGSGASSPLRRSAPPVRCDCSRSRCARNSAFPRTSRCRIRQASRSTTSLMKRRRRAPSRLCSGGQASLRTSDDPEEPGIDIYARPPGKRIGSLAQLSGGERALTATALLLAILRVRPAPFCVLDEVDAALDERNVGRFTQALRELTDRTQFVVITHNRATIEAADMLYGVSMD